MIANRAETESTENPAPQRLAHDTNAEMADLEIALPVTLSGIYQDLLVHAPLRGRSSWAIYVARVLLTALASSGFHMVFSYRLGAFLHRLGLRPLSFLVEKFIYHWYHCVIPCGARIGPGLWVPHPLGIVLNSNARLGANVWLRQGCEIVHIPPGMRDKTGIVGDRVQLNSGAILVKGAVIGHDSIVSARAVVTKFVPPGHIAMGIPAQFTPMRLEQFMDRTPRWKPSPLAGDAPTS